MATQPNEYPDDAPEQEEGAPLAHEITMLEAINAPNLVPLLEEQDVARIGTTALQEYEIDLSTLTDFHERYDNAMDVAMQVRKAKTFPWPNASNVVFPLLTTAAIQFQARAYPAIIDGGQVAKGRVMGADPEGVKAERAKRIGDHMTWQFLHDVPGWEDDTDKLLLQLPIVGCVFRKTCRDSIRSQNTSETVSAKDFVVNYNTVSLDKAPRFTHVQRYYPHEIEAYIRAGEWSKVPYDGEDGSDPHSLVTIYEQNRLIDMDDDGLPEPYVVTFTEAGAVARIVACYDADGIFLTSPALGKQVVLSELMGMGPQVLGEDVKVVRIERKNYFTKYGFIPAPDGSFYDIGFGTLTENLGRAVNTIINQLIDAGTLANMQGGFIGGGTKIKGGNMRFTPGEWKRVEGATSGPLRENILPLSLPGPNATLFQLLGMLIEAVQNITSVSDILSGNQDSQTAPTTALALIEQGQKVFTAIYQRIHRALGGEIKIMRGLNRDYLDEEQYFALHDTPQTVGRADYEDKDLDVVPVSDPRAINDRVKMAKAEVLMGFNGDPLVNQTEIRQRTFEAAGIENPKVLLDVPPSPPPPEAVKAMAETDALAMTAKADVRAKDAATAASLITAAKGAYELGALIGDVAMQQFAIEMLGDAQSLASAVYAATQGETNGQPADGPGAVPGMGGEPADQGLPPIPDGLPPPTGDGMGGGLPDDGGAAIAGGDVGGPSGAVVQ
jgi:chaperonin GroES